MSGYVANNRDERQAPEIPQYSGAFDQQPLRQMDRPSPLAPEPLPSPPAQCVFAKPSSLPLGALDYPSVVPAELASAYGQTAILATTDVQAAGGGLLLTRAAGQLLGGGTWAIQSAGGIATGSGAAGAAGSGILATAATTAIGFVALLWPSPMGGSDLYRKSELEVLSTAKTRLRFHVEHDWTNGSIRTYGFHTSSRSGFDSVPVVAASAQGDQAVVDLGDGVTILWTPQVDPTAGTPPLPEHIQGLTETIWIYPVSENAAQALENPIYPSDYKDFIITFPDHPGVQPVYVVLSTQLDKNKARGREFEDEVYGDYSSTRSETGREVTVKTKSGTRTRIDMVGREPDGTISCVECKSSDTAPLTPNQKVAFPEIEESGAVVVGKGKPGFPGGTDIPPTKVDVVRPN
ncbi:S-type pyocin domain-containing protein [Pseudomonas sp. J452]|uniref:S-type pyocin domain-containing protein n=1 Tax=Pseudomonas sp. J452 TaxID=2898441 RepID=UPI0021AD6A49|nr:S-type pyocin domain-containing protein [Pseudomonas sp. J452]UUY07711.1 S-type pyocin domain-containing protein [Pseudomonas sp. J452]